MIMAWLRRLHLWLGLSLALLLLAQALSGLALIFHDDIVMARLPAHAQALPPPDGAALAADLARIGELAADRGWTRIMLPSASLPLYRVTLAGGGTALMAPDADRFADQWQGNARPEAWLLDLHFRLLMGHDGETLAGIAGLLGLFMLASGVILWWPRRTAWRWAALALRVGGRRTKWLAFHWSWGVLAAGFIGLSMATGAGMIFYQPLAKLLRAGNVTPPHVHSGDAARLPADWAGLTAAASSVWPDAQLRMLSNAAPGSAVMAWRVKRAGEMHPNGRSVIFIDKRDNRLIASHDATAMTVQSRAMHALYPIHSGRGYALFTLTAVLAGLGLAAMTVSGLAAYIAKRRRRNKDAPAFSRSS